MKDDRREKGIQLVDPKEDDKYIGMDEIKKWKCGAEMEEKAEMMTRSWLIVVEANIFISFECYN